MPIQIKRVPVDSSMLSAIGYDEKSKTLYAEFSNTGNIYAYEDVPKTEYEELLEASSVGRHMRSSIIDCYRDHQVRRGRDIKW